MTAIIFITDAETLHATLDDTPYAREFAAMLPLEIEMGDYHGVEKVADLPHKLDTTAAPTSYEPAIGDITTYAPWGNLALFYKPFSNSSGLVRLGEFDAASKSKLATLEGRVRIEVSE